MAASGSDMTPKTARRNRAFSSWKLVADCSQVSRILIVETGPFRWWCVGSRMVWREVVCWILGRALGRENTETSNLDEKNANHAGAPSQNEYLKSRKNKSKEHGKNLSRS